MKAVKRGEKKRGKNWPRTYIYSNIETSKHYVGVIKHYACVIFVWWDWKLEKYHVIDEIVDT